MSVDKSKLEFIDKLVYKAQGQDKNWGEYEVDSIYFTRANGIPMPNPD